MNKPLNNENQTLRRSQPKQETAITGARQPQKEITTGRRVLIIEDNNDVADSLSEALDLLGHHVSVAYSGVDGVAKAHQLRPEVILCDIGLPEMDGYSVARELRRDAMGESVFLIALTGYAQPEDQLRARKAGFDAHLTKPPDLAVLERLLIETPSVGESN